MRRGRAGGPGLDRLRGRFRLAVEIRFRRFPGAAFIFSEEPPATRASAQRLSRRHLGRLEELPVAGLSGDIERGRSIPWDAALQFNQFRGMPLSLAKESGGWPRQQRSRKPGLRVSLSPRN